MMDLGDLIKPEAVIGSLKANSKKQAIQAIAEKAAELTGIPEREIFETLLQREKLGSTGVGGGIAIPHGKLASLERIFGLFARLPKPIDFEALDDQPVDLVFQEFADTACVREHGADLDCEPVGDFLTGETLDFQEFETAPGLRFDHAANPAACHIEDLLIRDRVEVGGEIVVGFMGSEPVPVGHAA